MNSTEVINVVVADDSAFLRKSIANILKDHESIKIVEFAKDGEEAVEYVKKHNPDVLVLDLLMPKMNGLDAFKVIMEEKPVPTVILSAINPKNLDSSIQALLMGAFDYIIKPGGIGAKDLPRFREELLAKVLLASQSQIKKVFQKEKDNSSKSKTLRQKMVDNIFDFGQYINKLRPIEEIEKKSKISITEKEKIKTTLKEEIEPTKRKGTKVAPVSVLLKKKASTYIKEIEPDYIPDLKPVRGIFLSSKIVVIGASVGGPRTISTILREIPKFTRAPILIVQHLSAHFTSAFAENLNSECELDIKVAKNGELIQTGKVYIAPGEYHMEISEKNRYPCIKIYKGKPVNFCIPSIDVLFFSAAKIYRNRALGILLTGMGADGVNGLGAIQKVGGRTISESEETCILYAMPKFAAEKGYSDYILPNHAISSCILKFVKGT